MGPKKKEEKSPFHVLKGHHVAKRTILTMCTMRSKCCQIVGCWFRRPHVRQSVSPKVPSVCHLGIFIDIYFSLPFCHVKASGAESSLFKEISKLFFFTYA